MFDGSNEIEYPKDLFFGEDFRQFFWHFRPGDLLHFFRRLQGDPVQKLDRCHVHSQIRGRDLALSYEIEEKRSNFLLFQFIW